MTFQRRARLYAAELAQRLESATPTEARAQIEGFQSALNHWADARLDIAARRAREYRAKRREGVAEAVHEAVKQWAPTIPWLYLRGVPWHLIRETVPMGNDEDLARALVAHGFKRVRVEIRGRRMRAWRPPPKR